MINLKQTALSLLLSASLAAPAMAQTVVFNGHASEHTEAVNIGGNFFLSVEALNQAFSHIDGLDVNNYSMYFERLGPGAVTVDGQLLVPVRAFAEAMGWEVNWLDGQIVIEFPSDYMSLEEWVAVFGVPAELAELVDQGYLTFEDIDLEALLTPTPALPVQTSDVWIPWPAILNVVPEAPVVLENPEIHGALHRVTYGDNVAYILGSFHLGLDHWFPLAPVVEEAMLGADVFAFEADLFVPSDAEVERFMTVLEELAILPEGQTWVDILPTELYEAFVDMLVEEFEISYEDNNDLNPAVVIMEISVYLLESMTTLDQGFSVDAYVAWTALNLDRPIVGLATMYSELAQVFGVPHEVMIDQVASFVEGRDYLWDTDAWDSWDPMITAYESNDLATLIELIGEGMFLYTAETPHEIYTRDVINFTRSIQFGQAISELLTATEDPTTFFVTVGISHVIRGGLGLNEDGITNVINYLEQAGFAIEALH